MYLKINQTYLNNGTIQFLLAFGREMLIESYENNGKNLVTCLIMDLYPEEVRLNGGRFSNFQKDLYENCFEKSIDTLKLKNIIESTNSKNVPWNMELKSFDNKKSMVFNFYFEDKDLAVYQKLK